MTPDTEKIAEELCRKFYAGDSHLPENCALLKALRSYGDAKLEEAASICDAGDHEVLDSRCREISKALAKEIRSLNSRSGEEGK